MSSNKRASPSRTERELKRLKDCMYWGEANQKRGVKSPQTITVIVISDSDDGDSDDDVDVMDAHVTLVNGKMVVESLHVKTELEIDMDNIEAMSEDEFKSIFSVDVPVVVVPVVVVEVSGDGGEAVVTIPAAAAAVVVSLPRLPPLEYDVDEEDDYVLPDDDFDEMAAWVC